MKYFLFQSKTEQAMLDFQRMWVSQRLLIIYVLEQAEHILISS